MKINEVRELKTEEIKRQIEEEEDLLTDMRFSHELKQLTNTAKMKDARRTIARLKTVLREREMEAEKENKETTEAEEK